MTIFNQEKEDGMTVEIKDEMIVEVFIRVFLSDNFFSVSMQRSNFLDYIIDFETRKWSS